MHQHKIQAAPSTALRIADMLDLVLRVGLVGFVAAGALSVIANWADFL